MANVIAIDTKTAKDIVSSLKELKEEVASLKKIISSPPYGSYQWWDTEIKQGEKDIRAGNYKTYKSAKSLISDLHKS